MHCDNELETGSGDEGAMVNADVPYQPEDL
jgi:hypothetical protein